MCAHESDTITKSLSYSGDSDWGKWMRLTHKQTLCTECHLYKIWKWKGKPRKRPSYKYYFKEEIERDLL